MTDAIALIFAFLSALLVFGIVVFCIAWVTVLPTIGLLFWTGALS